MIQEFVDAFDAKREAIKADLSKVDVQWSYLDLVTLLVEHIDSMQLSSERITELDYGGYQGKKVFVIAEQDDAMSYYYTHVWYGSCGGCDALYDALDYTGDDRTDALFRIVLTMLQNLEQMEL